MTSTSISKDKICGMVCGHFLGDALGTPFEYNKSGDAYQGKLDACRRFNRYKNIETFCVKGQVSDDTEMAIILASQVHEVSPDVSVDLVKESLVLWYMRWANSKCPFLGKNTRALFHGVKTMRGYSGRYAQIDHESAQSNGCLMRAYPLALLPETTYTDKLILMDCNTTNANDVCREVVRLYIQLLRMALHSDSKSDSIRSFLGKYTSKSREILTAIQSGLQGALVDISNQRGWIVHALYCAIYCLFASNSYREGVDMAIRHSNGRGDTDTNACITGALLGAYYGWSKFDDHSKGEVREVLAADTAAGDHERPPEYHPMRLIEIYSLSKLVRDPTA